MFHKIYHSSSSICLPQYLVSLSSNERLRLRSNVMPPDRLGSAGFAASGMRNHNRLRDNHFDELALKSVVEAKCHAFRSSFFFRTHSLWNDLPLSLNQENSFSVFKTNLKAHFWDLMIEPE